VFVLLIITVPFFCRPVCIAAEAMRRSAGIICTVCCMVQLWRDAVVNNAVAGWHGSCVLLANASVSDGASCSALFRVESIRHLHTYTAAVLFHRQGIITDSCRLTTVSSRGEKSFWIRVCVSQTVGRPHGHNDMLQLISTLVCVNPSFCLLKLGLATRTFFRRPNALLLGHILNWVPKTIGLLYLHLLQNQQELIQYWTTHK
jgi:hypothetical protein